MVSLQDLHTFQMPVYAKQVIELYSDSEIIQFIHQNHQKYYLLGGGSNVVFTEYFDGVIGKICSKGIQIVDQENEYSIVEFQAGEIWHEAVQWAVDNQLAGIENLALIPGTIGAAPIQNIGAYGIELKDVFAYADVYLIDQQEIIRFNIEDCQFDYRNSVFKQHLKGKAVILSVGLRLMKEESAKLNLEYGDVKQYYSEGIHKGIKGVMDAVVAIRESKLPDPKHIGNSGSFFKNPVISKELAEKIKLIHPALPTYLISNGVKLPAGWLIDQLGWKGVSESGIKVHDKQALVLTNNGVTQPKDLLKMVQKIQQSVWEKYSIVIEPEVNII